MKQNCNFLVLGVECTIEQKTSVLKPLLYEKKD